MRITLFFALSLGTFIALFGQNSPLPYARIPDYPEEYSAGAVVARLIDGLGFRFYWATEGLREQDLSFQPGEGTRTTRQTAEHIFEMSIIVLNATTRQANVPLPEVKMDFAELRRKTLENLKQASDRLRTASDEEMKNFKITFVQGDRSAEFPFWHNINGPLADCLWHVGQIVSFRRASGNPFSDKVNLFSGNGPN